ncbi:hypothetical protein [Oligella urethralis]|uniref:hypothetical protein n=1 Tax=Oligella urethralis TaxID=90245 RepID=UPI000E01B023|nr:hypothetical protein [Oligella urethralis]SUA58035.1 Uncharacterised protein [Oligella urethralis]
MARPKNDNIIAQTFEIAPDVAKQITAETHAFSTEVMAIDREFGDGLPFDEMRYQQKVGYHIRRSAEELLEACKALLVTRTHLDDGRWGEFLRRVGLEMRLAQRMIQTARKFKNPDTRPLLQAASNKTKVFELLVLDDEDLIKIASGDPTAPVQLDDVDRMTVSELRKALREARADGDATKKVLEDKNSKLDKQAAELEKLKTTKADRPKTDYNIRQVRADLQGDMYELELVLKRVSKGLEALQIADDGYDEIAVETMTKMQALMQSCVTEVGLDLNQPHVTTLAWATDLDDIEDAEVDYDSAH